MLKRVHQSMVANPLASSIALFVAVVFGSLGVGYLVQYPTFITPIDNYFYVLIGSMPRIQILDTLIYPFNTQFIPIKGLPAMPHYFYILNGAALIYSWIWKRKYFIWLLLSLILGTIIVGFVNGITWSYVFRERPFQTLPNNIDEVVKQGLKDWSSFPSGHVRETALYGTIISAFIKRLKWFMFALTVFVAFDRLYIGAHYPTDVIAGMVVGYVVARCTLLLVRAAQENQLLLGRKYPVQRI